MFDIIGSIFGYVLEFLLKVTNSYGLAIMLFAIISRLLMIPGNIKNRKNIVKQTKISTKQVELQKRYGKDRKKYDEELAKLYQKEGYNPLNGCWVMFIPLILITGIMNSVNHPLKSTLHLEAGKVNSAIEVVKQIKPSVSNNNVEIEIIKLFPQIKDQLVAFDEADLAEISEFHDGFDFLGLDLLQTPKGSDFSSMLWILPVLGFVAMVLSTIFLQKSNGNQAQVPGAGCMKYGMMIIMPLMFTWWVYTYPAAVGIFWITSSIFSIFDSILMQKMFSKEKVTIMEEARRIARLELNEKEVSERQEITNDID